MLKDATGFSHIYVVCGRTDLRRGIDGLAGMVANQFRLNPFESGSIFLFCGRRPDRIKALVYEDDGFVLLIKRLSDGKFQWPQSADEVKSLTQGQFNDLMNGFAIVRKQTINTVTPRII